MTEGSKDSKTEQKNILVGVMGRDQTLLPDDISV